MSQRRLRQVNMTAKMIDNKTLCECGESVFDGGVPGGHSRGACRQTCSLCARSASDGGVPGDPSRGACRSHAFRTWRLFVGSQRGKQIVVMWNRNDRVSHVKKYLELKTGLPCGLQVLRKRGVEKPLVEDRLLYNSSVRDQDTIITTSALPPPSRSS